MTKKNNNKTTRKIRMPDSTRSQTATSSSGYYAQLSGKKRGKKEAVERMEKLNKTTENL